jgi:hypothetical protein
MYIRSTGLGKTLLKAEAANIEAINIIPETLEESEEGDEPTRLLMTMQTLEPVHWTVRVFVEPPDLRRMLWVALKSPTVLYWSLRFLFSKGPKPKKIESDE